MKYISLNNVIEAFQNNAGKTSDGFWGIIAIRLSIFGTVLSEKVYNLDSTEIANKLEEWFSIKNELKKYNGNTQWSVVFSSQWEEQFFSMFIKGNKKPNLYDVIAWTFQNRPFEIEPSKDELISLFSKEISITEENLKSFLDISNRDISFQDKPFDQSEKVNKIISVYGKPSDESHSINCNGAYIVSDAGSFQRAPFIQTLYASTEKNKCLLLTNFSLSEYYPDNFEEIKKSFSDNKTETLQQIFFGAPGVGKSHHLKSVYKDEKDVARITFHPETDYASFVGCYKPIQKIKVRNIISSEELISKAQLLKGKDVENAVSKQVQFLFDNAESIIPAVNELGLKSVNQLVINKFGWSNETYFACILKSLLDNKEDDSGDITYRFVPQTFTEAYIEAWRRFYNDVPRKDYFLVIEEINRGNCAQIFGDIFQLLDRNEEGFSDYSVNSDKDLSQFLKEQFANLHLTEKLNIRKQGLGDGIALILPPNLHIIATMNTSDQSLFPIDSAFKRRWEWVYMPIETKPTNNNGDIIEREIEVGNNRYDWGDFLESVNKKIYDITQSEDKQLGFWFVKPKNGNIIPAKEFVSKVIFYLWNDIYKDFGDDASSIFNFSKDGNPNSNDKERHSFKQFTLHFQEIDINMVDAFLKNLDLKPKLKKAGNSAQTETESVSESEEVNNADNN